MGKKHTHKKHRQNNKTHKKKHTNKNIYSKKKKTLRCAPGRDHKFTCYNSNGLHQLKNAWNNKYTNKRINTNNPYDIWKYFSTQFNNMCNDEKCWLKQTFINDNLTIDLKKYTFAPDSPYSWNNTPNEWLSSDEISNVMKQYEKTHDDFVFIGPSPIDFNKKTLFNDCIWEDLCKFDLREYIDKGKTKIGIIFNLDPADKDGSHWVASFIDTKRKGIYYYDSNGIKAPKRIKDFLNKVKEQGKHKDINIKFKLEQNSNEHQMSDGECGMFTIYYIINMLKKQSFKQFKKKFKGGGDGYMNKLRKILFN